MTSSVQPPGEPEWVRFHVDRFGRRVEDVSHMLAPVECGSCHRRYDSANVTVLQRYLDCSVWKAPCCGILADDRQYVGRVTAITLNRDGSRR